MDVEQGSVMAARAAGGAESTTGISGSRKRNAMSSSRNVNTDTSRRGPRGNARSESWPERCARLFEDMWRPARAMVARAYGRALSDEEIRDVYSAAWTATLSALRTRGEAMAEEELRAYVLTAVASHASKEMRRRSRKPAGSLDEAQEQVITDGHQLLPEERVIGSESRGIARDLLSSLPPRRRAVMLLRYGWGLKPEEVCKLVSGLSARAYRKEVTRGVEQLIERLKLVESGEWCESREPLLREYVAGTADAEVRRQVEEHLDHCRGCASFASKLTGNLQELGGAVALTAMAGILSGSKLSGLERLTDAWQAARGVLASNVERAEATATTVAASGGGRGAGAAGAGVIAKVAGLGGAGKAALACIGLSAAASACVAVGAIPGLSVGDLTPSHQAASERESVRPGHRVKELVEAPTLGRGDLPAVLTPAMPAEHAGAPPETPSEGELEPPQEASVDTAPVASTSAQEEFDPVASDPDPNPATTQPVQPSPTPTPAAPASTGPSASASSTAGDEFGP